MPQKEEPSRPEERQREKAATLIDESGAPLAEDSDSPSRARLRKRPLYKRPAFLIAAAVVLLVGAAFLVRYWLYARSHESTDDAFIDGHIIQVSPKASGYVSKVYVTDNQPVKAGDLLAELDARDYEARLDQAKAALAAGLAQQHQAESQVVAHARHNGCERAAGFRGSAAGAFRR